jgi:phosphoserine phosphatase RsbU/P
MELLDKTQLSALIRRIETFTHLPESVAADLLAGGTCVEFAEGELLIRQGDESLFALVLVDGVADVIVETKYGAAHLAAINAPALVGDIGVFTLVSRTASIFAKTSVRAIRIEGRALHHAGEQNPRFLSAILAQLGHRLETFNKAIGFYSHALSALRLDEFNMALLDDLMNPLPELADFSRSFRQLAEQITIQRAHRAEMASAQAIQRAMLPTRNMLNRSQAFVTIHAEMRAARDVGGDLYDFFEIDEDRLVITIGDVCGKGIPAALFMAMTQTVMRYVLRHENNLEAAIAAANVLLATDNRESMYATLFCAVVNFRTGDLQYCGCGHDFPLILRSDGDLEAVSSSENLPLGLKLRADFRGNTTVLRHDDRLLLFTDGFTDATNTNGERFGSKRLSDAVKLLNGVDSQHVIGRLIGAIDKFADGAQQFDDLTAVLLTMSTELRD